MGKTWDGSGVGKEGTNFKKEQLITRVKYV